jgi:hypothetical protein
MHGNLDPAPAAHRAQTHIPFPHHHPWFPWQKSERYPLWPRAGHADSFVEREFTAYLRPAAATAHLAPLEEHTGYWQIFVCRGAITLPTPAGRSTAVPQGAFVSGLFPTSVIDGMAQSPDTLCLVKYCAVAPEGASPFEVTAQYSYFENPYAGGLLDPYGAAPLGGNAFKRDAPFTALVRFPVGAVVSSHYHAPPTFHEFIYLVGGHLTPDGFYGPGDHVTSIPGGKEGPWLAATQADAPYPADWPRWTPPPAVVPPPFPSPLGAADGHIYGLLFVHHGAFIHRDGRIRWHQLGASELGPTG